MLNLIFTTLIIDATVSQWIIKGYYDPLVSHNTALCFSAPLKSVKKLYSKDDQVPVPRSTSYRWKKRIKFEHERGNVIPKRYFL